MTSNYYAPEGAFATSLGLVRWVGWAQRRAGEDWIRARELSHEQSFVLGYLASNPGAIQRDIADMSVTQGVIFIPIVLLGNLLFGLAGIVWARTVTEGLMLLVGVAMWFVSRSAIDRGLDEGRPERADEVLEQAPA